MKTIIFLVIAAILAGLAAVYGLFGSNSGPAAEEVGETELENMVDETNKVQVITGEATLGALDDFGKNYECKISYIDPDLIEPVIGTYFIAGKKVRGDFEINSPEYNDPVVSSVIHDGATFYSWSKISGESYGVKIAGTNRSEVDSSQLREPIPSDATVSYECFEWKNVDGSIFLAPTNVLFKDLGEVIESGMEFGTIYEE